MEDNKFDFSKIKKPKTRYETYQTDIFDYLVNKLKNHDVPAHIIFEIAQYAMTQTAIVVNDEVNRARKEVSREYRTFFRHRGEN